MLTSAIHLGLYAEETSHTAEQLSVFPQAFAHPSLIGAGFGRDRATD
ncbi:hypothetical protein [Streptomyces sp. NPDC018000]